MNVESKNNIFEIWSEDEIMYSRFLNPITLDRALGEVFLESRHQFSNGQKQYWCFDFTNVLSMTKDARDHAAKSGQNMLHASAAVVSNSIQAFIINIFNLLKRPRIPFKAFSCKEEAVAWLLELKAKNGH